MNEPVFPSQQGAWQHVLTDAAGRTFYSSAPPPASAFVQGQVPQSMTPPCGCSHAPTPQVRQYGPPPAALIAAGVVGTVAVGAVLVALLLSIAIVAAAIATTALSITVAAVVLRSLVNNQGPRGRYRRR
ncbi:hypothetical protein [Streptomyces sp. cg36]|uniref:hypothetical protein n=1 Tax=Streptomyces sp. cg36 TaxID=3238798 RepID=UPI0034E20D43